MNQLRIVSLSESNRMLISSNENNLNIDNDIESEDTSDTETIGSNNENQIGNKRKRQRLTHLTPEEKVMRRKLKNRIAAQSARDRKKVKMDDLEETCKQLKDHNEKLIKENKLLKEKAQLLIDENRKLLKFKSDTEKSVTKINPKPVELVKVVPHESNLLKRFIGADESAVFTKYASQQKRQLQGMYQKIIFMLILQTMNLIKQEMLNPQSSHVHKNRITKLRLTLIKLYKLAIAKKKLAKPQNSIQVMNTFRISKEASSLNLALMITMIVKSFKMKRI